MLDLVIVVLAAVIAAPVILGLARMFFPRPESDLAEFTRDLPWIVLRDLAWGSHPSWPLLKALVFLVLAVSVAVMAYRLVGMAAGSIA